MYVRINTILSVQVLQEALRHNFPAAILFLGSVAMGVHADLSRNAHGCPVSILVGKSGRGKSTALNFGMSVVGE